MFHKAIGLKLLAGTALEVSFEDGTVKRYDMRKLFSKYPQLRALEDRTLFLSAKLAGAYGIIWNDDLDIETEAVYEDGETISLESVTIHYASAQAVSAARARAGISQQRLAELTGIDQSDISKIERGRERCGDQARLRTVLNHDGALAGGHFVLFVPVHELCD